MKTNTEQMAIASEVLAHELRMRYDNLELASMPPIQHCPPGNAEGCVLDTAMWRKNNLKRAAYAARSALKGLQLEDEIYNVHNS